MPRLASVVLLNTKLTVGMHVNVCASVIDCIHNSRVCVMGVCVKTNTPGDANVWLSVSSDVRGSRAGE